MDDVSIYFHLWLTLCALAVSTAAVYDRNVATPTLQEAKVQGNDECKEHQFYNITKPGCEDCKICGGDEPYTIRPCDKYNNTICSPCEKRFVYSDLEETCVRCCPCTSKHQSQQMCRDAGLPHGQSCIGEEGAPCGPEPSATDKPWYKHTLYLILGCVVVVIVVMVIVIGVIIARIEKIKKLQTEEEKLPIEDAEVHHDDHAELVANEEVEPRCDEVQVIRPDQATHTKVILDNPTAEPAVRRNEDERNRHQLLIS